MAKRATASMHQGASTSYPPTGNNDDQDMDAASEDDPSDSESEEEEDEEGEELTPALDAAILRTLARIRNKDEAVYGSGPVLQEELARLSTEVPDFELRIRSKDDGKRFTLQDHQRSAVLSGRIPGLDDETDEPQDLPDSIIPLSQVEEERQLRAEVTSAFKTAIPDAQEDQVEEDDFLVKKDVSQAEVDKQQAKYREFLLKHGGGEDEVRKVLGISNDSGATSTLDFLGSDVNGIDGPDPRNARPETSKPSRTKKDDDQFLMDYILNRGWVDNGDEEQAPSIKAKKPKVSAASSSKNPWGELEDEDEFDDMAEEFETTYNFRFEEPGAANIVSHPRILTSTVRRGDDSRKTARELKNERKAERAAAHEEKMRREKGKMRREIEKRLDELKAELGEEALEGLDLEGDWDEARHDQAMQDLMAAEHDDDEKPTWGDDGDDAGIAEDAGDAVVEEQAWEQEDPEAPINMDADFIEIPTEGSSKKKKKNKKKEKRSKHQHEEEEVDLGAEAELPAEEKKEKLKERLDEYRKLDHEDMIGDLPTRFKYAKSAPQTFGLSPAEILMATDAELNSFIGMKHLAPYRHGGLGAAGREHGKKLRDLKTRIARRKWGEEFDADADAKADERKRDAGWQNRSDSAPKKRKGKKERMREAAAGAAGDEDARPAKRQHV